MRFIDVCHVDLKRNLKEHLGYAGLPDNTKTFIQHLVGQSSVEAFAKSLGVSRSLVSSWLTGRRQPSLVQILAMLNLEGCLHPFVESLTDSRVFHSLTPAAGLEKKKRDLQYAYPEVAGVLACLDLKEYMDHPGHKKGFISKVVGISEEQEKKLLRLMMDAGYLRQEPNGKYLIEEFTLDTRGNFQGTVKLRKFWIKKALELLDQVESITEKNRYAHFIFSVSEDADQKIREATYEYISAIKLIVTQDLGAPTLVRSLNIQDIDIAEHAEKCGR